MLCAAARCAGRARLAPRVGLACAVHPSADFRPLDLDGATAQAIARASAYALTLRCRSQIEQCYGLAEAARTAATGTISIAYAFAVFQD